jgi:hypothetical protein
MSLTGAWRHVPNHEHRVRRESVQIVRDGRRWSGMWLTEGDKIFVISPHGSRTAIVRQARDRAAIAEALLGEIVDAQVRP